MATRRPRNPLWIERYALETFGYSVPTPKDGKYTFIFRFAEAYWTHPQGKIFDVVVAGATVVKGLDIFEKVRREARPRL